jgi:hypothetical protein
MNSTSACERGGSVALVDSGRVVLGLPGAPGCTTTGVVGSVRCARAGKKKRPVGALAARSVPHSTADLLAEWNLRLWRKWSSLQFGASLNIFSALTVKEAAKRKTEK